MAALYVVVRGVALSERVTPPLSGDVRAILYENARIAVPAGAWFVAAMAVSAATFYLRELGELLAAVEGALAGAGLGVVGLYAVATATATLRERGGMDSTVATDDD